MLLSVASRSAGAAFRRAARLARGAEERRHLSTLRPFSRLQRIGQCSAPALVTKRPQPVLFYPRVSRCLADSSSELAKPSAIQEASVRELVLSPPALVVTREYEWANILVGFEQANKYTIRAAPGGQVVGYLAEVGSSRPCKS